MGFLSATGIYIIATFIRFYQDWTLGWRIINCADQFETRTRPSLSGIWIVISCD